MSKILGGAAPLRGRAGLNLCVSPFDFRVARELHDIADLKTAFRTYGVIGGVAAYARKMSEGDLPTGPDDFDRWVRGCVLSPAAPLFDEAPLLLNADPATAKARKINLYHAALAVLDLADRLGEIVDVSTDTVGLALAEQSLPQRVRWPKQATRRGTSDPSGGSHE